MGISLETPVSTVSANPPPFLKNATTPLSRQDFSTVKTKEECKEIHDHLFLTLQLLERVIRARKLHHSRFFAEDCDYGHEKYLEGLQSQKGTVIRALERLERRTAEVIYGEQKWYNWVRECQDEEERGREKVREKVKMEAAMFKRHWKAAQLRAKDVKAKEDKMRQDAYLEQVYKERLAEKEKIQGMMRWNGILSRMSWRTTGEVILVCCGHDLSHTSFSIVHTTSKALENV